MGLFNFGKTNTATVIKKTSEAAATPATESIICPECKREIFKEEAKKCRFMMFLLVCLIMKDLLNTLDL